MKILIVTGIYPPEIGGPAQYAKNLEDIWRGQGHKVSVRVFSQFNFLPTGVRHLAYLAYILPAVFRADCILALDTFSAALPAVLAARMLGKKIVLRTGGDFLWEAYVERTGELVLLKNFYQTSIDKLSKKERDIFKMIKYVLNHVDAIVWSTEWQKNIFMKPYKLENQKHFIIENYYGPKLASYEPKEKNFIAATRALKWKNTELVEAAFARPDVSETGAFLDTRAVPREQFLDKISHSYATILATLGDISPNTILDTIRHDKPFIVTRETGIAERIRDCALFVDPQSEADIAEKVLFLANPANYALQKAKVQAFTFTHSWEDMAKEYIDIWNRL